MWKTLSISHVCSAFFLLFASQLCVFLLPLCAFIECNLHVQCEFKSQSQSTGYSSMHARVWYKPRCAEWTFNVNTHTHEFVDMDTQIKGKVNHKRLSIYWMFYCIINAATISRRIENKKHRKVFICKMAECVVSFSWRQMNQNYSYYWHFQAMCLKITIKHHIHVSKVPFFCEWNVNDMLQFVQSKEKKINKRGQLHNIRFALIDLKGW